MRTAVVSLTKNGAGLAFRLGKSLKADTYMKKEFIGFFKNAEFTAGQDNEEFPTAPVDTVGIYAVEDSFTKLSGRLFQEYQSLVFIMACGIVIRAIAPYIKDKRSDPAVVVVDEMGKFAISLLSGHTGGANKLACDVAAVTGGTPVITTATDVNGMIAFDVFAKENDCAIENNEMLKYISAELVNGGMVNLYTDLKLKGIMPDNIIIRSAKEIPGNDPAVFISNSSGIGVQTERILYLRPRNLILGIGCRRGILKEHLREAVIDFLCKNKKSLFSVKCAATIDLKKEEKGIIEFCSEFKLPLQVISRKAVADIEEEYTASDFVREKVGVSSVAEPCAVLGGRKAVLICGKTKYNGITLALAEEEKVLYI